MSAAVQIVSKNANDLAAPFNQGITFLILESLGNARFGNRPIVVEAGCGVPSFDNKVTEAENDEDRDNLAHGCTCHANTIASADAFVDYRLAIPSFSTI